MIIWKGARNIIGRISMFRKKSKEKYIFNTDPSNRFIAQSGEYKVVDANGKSIDWEERKKEKERLKIWAYGNCFPLGSVVKLGGSQVLIVSVNVSNGKTKYKGCHYPQGIDSIGDLIEFYHADIDGLYFMGYWNEEMKKTAGFNV